MNYKKLFSKLSTWVAAILTISLVACGGGGSGSSAGGNSNPYIAELTNNVGLRVFNEGNTYSSRAPEAWIDSAVKNNDGTYTFSGSVKYLNGGAWVSQTSPAQGYYLSSNGNWVDSSSVASMVVGVNSNGTITLFDTPLGNLAATPMAVDISGAGINAGKDVTLSVPSGSKIVKVGSTSAIDAAGYDTGATSVISNSATYPAGSTEWILTGMVSQQDGYSIYNASSPQVSTPSGNLTSLAFANVTSFTSSNPLCFSSVKLVYASTLASNTARFDVYQAAPSCTAIVGGTTKLATVELRFTTVRTQAVVETSNYSVTGTSQYPFTYVYPSFTETAFLAAVNGAVYWGIKLPANSPSDEMGSKKYGYKNKVAMDAVMNAASLPTF